MNFSKNPVVTVAQTDNFPPCAGGERGGALIADVQTKKALARKCIARQTRLRFYDIDIIIKSDSGKFVDYFTRLYRRFCEDGPPSLTEESRSVGRFPDSTMARSTFEFILLSNPDNPWGGQVMICNDEVWPLYDQRLLEGYAYEMVLSAIITKIRSHLLLHAGVVSCNGQGVIIVADSMHGKTTLVVELVRRGFRFLSDEMAALGRHDHAVHPFPRSLWIRKGTLELAGLHDKAVNALQWMGKTILDIEEIVPDRLGTAVPVGHIIMLKNPDEKRESGREGTGQEVCMMIDRFDEEFLAEVQRGEGITHVRESVHEGYPAIRFRAARPNVALSRAELLCRQYRILVLDVIKGEREYPTFNARAVHQEIPASQAITDILSRYQGGYLSDVLHDEFQGNAVRLFLELSTLVSRAKCHRISVGPLNEVADLVCRAVNA